MPHDVKAAIDSVLASLDQRRNLRAQVDSLTIDAPKALGHHTHSNAGALGAIKQVAKIGKDPNVMFKINALEALLKAKEFSGIGRAIGLGGVAVGEFSLSRGMVFQGLITKQELALNSFLKSTTPEFAARLQQIDELDEAASLEEMREVALASMSTGDLQGVSPDQFFQAAIVRISASAQWLPASGRDPLPGGGLLANHERGGLGHTQGAGLAVKQRDARRRLRGRLKQSHRQIRSTGKYEYGSRIAVHRIGADHDADPRGPAHLDRRSRKITPLSSFPRNDCRAVDQHLHRTALAVAEAGGDLPRRDHRRRPGSMRHPELDGIPRLIGRHPDDTCRAALERQKAARNRNPIHL